MGKINRELQKLDWRWRMDCQIAMLVDSMQGCESALDVGCGNGSPLIEVEGIRKFGVDGFDPSVNAARASGKYEHVEFSDLLNYLRSRDPGAFDAVVALDVIEHFDFADGFEMLQEMERVASRIVVVATPNGFLAQEGNLNPYQEHRSGWQAREFMARGYETFGLYGAKFFRSQGHELIFGSSNLFAKASWKSQRFVLNRPSLATALFGVKRVKA